MQRLTPSVLVIVVLVALAGCNAFSGGSDTSTDTPMITPMDVPTDEPTQTFALTATPTDTPMPTLTPVEPRLPRRCTPGLSEFGFANVSALAAAHNATLRNTSFTASYTSTDIYQNGSIADHTMRTIRVAENHSRIHYITQWIESRSSTSIESFEMWTNGSQVVKRRISGHTARYEAQPLPPEERDYLSVLVQYYANFPEDLLGNATVCVTDRFTHNETTFFVVTFRTEPPYRLQPNTTVVRNVTGRALISSSGIVHELRWYHTVRTDDGTVLTHTTSISYTEIGSTTVERPVWYEKAINQT